MATTTATKTGATIQSSTSNSAGGTTTSSARDVSATFGGVLTARITNGGTGPTLPCECRVQGSHDSGTTWLELGRAAGGVANSTAYDLPFEVPAGVMRIRTSFTGNTGQAVTVEAYFQELTSIATA